MRVALKEWSVVIEALAGGRQAFLLRKGGIAEGRRGFELRHKEFLFYPTWEHQQTALIRPEFHDDFERAKPRGEGMVPIGLLGKVWSVQPAPRSPETLAEMADTHIWNERFIRTRYEYRPDLPLYLVFVRAFRLRQTVKIPYDHRYAGCRSWVDLNEDIDVAGAEPVLPIDIFERAVGRALGAAAGQRRT